MRHFPVFLDMAGQHVVVSGAGETALAKLRLLLKTEARISVFGEDAHPDVRALAAQGRIRLTERAVREGDSLCARLFYCANDDQDEDARAAAIGHAGGALVNVVDNLDESQFITPAIVDRDPVTVAIGTEGAAPVLARRIKADLEERLPANLGVLAAIAKRFRHRAEALPQGRRRRSFWSRFYGGAGASAFSSGGEAGVEAVLETLLAESSAEKPEEGRVILVGAGPGDPDLLTMKARRALHDADVVLHDALVPAPILELARREATIIETGKRGFRASWKQDDINAEMIRHAREGAVVVRLKAGDPALYGRMDEELDALDEAGISWDIIPGVTSASAAAASTGSSLTRRGRNSELRIITGHDTEGFADQQWRALARPGATAAIYMGIRAARFLQGRLLMHGAGAAHPVTVIENAARPDERIIATTLADLSQALESAEISGPALILYGIEARRTARADALPAATLNFAQTGA